MFFVGLLDLCVVELAGTSHRSLRMQLVSFFTFVNSGAMRSAHHDNQLPTPITQTSGHGHPPTSLPVLLRTEQEDGGTFRAGVVLQFDLVSFGSVPTVAWNNASTPHLCVSSVASFRCRAVGYCTRNNIIGAYPPSIRGPQTRGYRVRRFHARITRSGCRSVRLVHGYHG